MDTFSTLKPKAETIFYTTKPIWANFWAFVRQIKKPVEHKWWQNNFWQKKNRERERERKSWNCVIGLNQFQSENNIGIPFTLHDLRYHVTNTMVDSSLCIRSPMPATDNLIPNTRQSKHNHQLAYRQFPTLKDYYKYTLFARTVVY